MLERVNSCVLIKVSSLQGSLKKKKGQLASIPLMGVFFPKAPTTTSSARVTKRERKWLGAEECEFPASWSFVRETMGTQKAAVRGFWKPPKSQRSHEIAVCHVGLSLHPSQTKDQTHWSQPPRQTWIPGEREGKGFSPGENLVPKLGSNWKE